MIPALVLTAGLATRLRPLSLVRAKAAMPVAGEPLVRRVLRHLRAEGVAEAVLNLHHLPHTITGLVGDGSDIGLRVRYSWEVPILGSAGGPRLALPIVGAETFLIANGDTLTSVDVAALVAEHRRTGALVTMAVAHEGERETPAWRARYGGVLADDSGAVTGFAKRGFAGPARHFVGVQAVEAEAFASLGPGIAAESVAGLYPNLIRSRPGSVRVHACTTEFFDIGTPADYLQTSLHLAAREGSDALLGARVRVAPGARVESCIVWDDVEIGEGAALRECIVADGVRVPPASSWTGVTLRQAAGELAAGERHVGDLAVSPIA